MINLNGPSNLADLESRLYNLRNLEQGWDGYTGKPLSDETAKFVLDFLMGSWQTFDIAPAVVPGTSGNDLQVEWHTEEYEIEVYIKRKKFVVK